jgi:hypothetical protein
MNLKRELEIYNQNFRSVYKNQTLRLVCNNYTAHLSTMISNHGVNSTIIFHKEVLRFIQQSCMDQETTFNQNAIF